MAVVAGDGRRAPLLRSSLGAPSASVLTSRSSLARQPVRMPTRWPGFESLTWRKGGRRSQADFLLGARGEMKERKREREG